MPTQYFQIGYNNILTHSFFKARLCDGTTLNLHVYLGGVQFESWLGCQLSWQRYFMAFLNLSRWVTAGAVPEMDHIMPIPYWAQWWWCFRLGLERQTVWFSAAVWAVHLIFSSVCWWKYHVCLAICHKSLPSTCLPNTFHDHLCRLWYVLSFCRVSLPGYYYLYKDQCWYSVASVCQVIAWWLLHHCQLSLIPPGHFWK